MNAEEFDFILDLAHEYLDRKETIVILEPPYLTYIVEYFAFVADLHMTPEEIESMVNILMTEY